MSLTTSTTGADHELWELRDRVQITDLVHRLGVCLDEGRFDEMRSLFVEDATARTPGGLAEGRDALVAQASRNHSPDQGIQHAITDLLVDVDGDDAKVRANLVVHFASAGDPPEGAVAPLATYALGEIYRFDLVRTPDGWRFSRVETIPIWMTGTRPIPRAV